MAGAAAGVCIPADRAATADGYIAASATDTLFRRIIFQFPQIIIVTIDLDAAGDCNWSIPTLILPPQQLTEDG